MNRKFALIGTAVLLMSSNGAWADENETTIRLMGAADDALPGAVTKEISLPDAFAEDSVAVENATRGLATANENRTRRETGLSTAEEARERAAEMADGAAETRENNGRGDRPDPPGRPGPPGPPGPPGGV